MKSLLFALPTVLLFVGSAIAAPDYRSDMTGAVATPKSKVHPRSDCPLPKKAPARGIAMARRQCLAGRRIQSGFVPDPSKPPIVPQGAGRR